MKFNFVFAVTVIVSLLTINTVAAQFIPNAANADDLEDQFMSSLPSDIQGAVKERNEQEEEQLAIDNLLSSETSLEKTKVLLRKINQQLNRVEEEINKQDPSFIKKDKLEFFGSNFFRTTQSSFAPINEPNMDGSYVVDVGDRFTITVVGAEDADFQAQVGRDGFLKLGKFGRLQIAGLQLSKVEEKLKDYLTTRSITSEIYIQLDTIRDIDVMILGHVENPGIYTLSGGSNLLSAINTAGGISKKGSYRAIKVTRNSSLHAVVDLYDLFVSGSTEVISLKLRSGDVIFVEPADFHVPVSGGVNVSAIFELKEGETITDVLNFAGGFSQDYTGFNYLTVYRSGLLGSRYLEITKDEYADLRLLPRDSLIVPSFGNDMRQAKYVHISGRVKRPGTYFINDGEKLSDLLERAGGYEDDAYLYGAALFRSENVQKEKDFSQISYQDTINYVVSSIGRPEVYVDDKVLPILSEELRSKAYEGRIVASFDMEELRRNPAKDVTLHHKDRIIIPAMQKVVYMFGEFNKPTSVIFNSELDTASYIKAAGGTKETAEGQLLVINPDGTTEIFKPGLLTFGSPDIYPGSIIYAPKDFGRLDGIQFSATLAPIVSSLAISLASLNSIND